MLKFIYYYLYCLVCSFIFCYFILAVTTFNILILYELNEKELSIFRLVAVIYSFAPWACAYLTGEYDRRDAVWNNSVKFYNSVIKKIKGALKK